MSSTAEIHRLEAYAALEAAAIVQLQFCKRHGLHVEWDNSKLLLLYDRFNVPKTWRDRIIGLARNDASKPGALEKAIQKLPAQFHETVFHSCACIVALQGFEADITMLVELKERMQIDDVRAEVIIDLAKGEAQMSRLGGKL